MIQAKTTVTKETIAYDYPEIYLKNWLLMKIDTSSGVNFLQKKRLTKQWTAYAKDFGLVDFDSLSHEAQEELQEKWKAFFSHLIQMCHDDKTYNSTLFGMVPMKKDTLSEKIANELTIVTEGYPTKLGLEDLYLPLHQCAKEVYYSQTA